MTDLNALHYTEEHEWIAIDGDVATIGITDYAAEKLGDVVYVDLHPLVLHGVLQFALVGHGVLLGVVRCRRCRCGRVLVRLRVSCWCDRRRRAARRPGQAGRL